MKYVPRIEWRVCAVLEQYLCNSGNGWNIRECFLYIHSLVAISTNYLFLFRRWSLILTQPLRARCGRHVENLNLAPTRSFSCLIYLMISTSDRNWIRSNSKLCRNIRSDCEFVSSIFPRGLASRFGDINTYVAFSYNLNYTPFGGHDCINTCRRRSPNLFRVYSNRIRPLCGRHVSSYPRLLHKIDYITACNQ